MGRLLYPKNKEFKGPWLVNRADLDSLAIVIEKIDELLGKSLTNKIIQEELEKNPELTEEELDEKIKRKNKLGSRNEHSISCELLSNDGTKLSDDSIKGLLKDGAARNFAATDLHISIIHGGYFSHKFDLRISRRYTGELKYEIECFDSSLREDVQYEIDVWIEQRKPGRLLSFWSINGMFTPLLLLLPSIILIFNLTTTSYTNYGNELRKKTHKLIEQGIDSTNINYAVELLLQSSSGYIPTEFIKEEKPKDPIYLKLFILSLIILIMGVIRPRTTIGIGRNENKYRFYKFWIWFVTVSIPSTLIIVPLWNKIVEWLY